MKIVGNNEIGLKSVRAVGEFIFGTGMIYDCFSVSGKFSSWRHLLNNFASTGLTTILDILKYFALMPCSPGLALVFKECMLFITSTSSMSSITKLDNIFRCNVSV